MKELELYPRKNIKSAKARTAALYYPGTYQESIINLGFQALYTLLSASEDWFCERFYYSFKDGLQSIDNSISIEDADAVFVTLSWEPHVFNVLDTLSKARLLLKRDRKIPVIAGGVLAETGNLAFLEDILDFVYIGEAEAGLPEILEKLASRISPDEVFKELCGKEFRLEDMSQSLAFTRILSSEVTGPFKSSFLVSVMRGCLNPCGFCLLGSRASRTLFMSIDRFMEILDPVIGRDDIASIGLVGTSPTQNPYFADYLEYIVKNGKKIGFSSLRIGNISDSPLIPFLNHTMHRTLTFAPDAASERLASLIQKPLSFEVLYDMIRNLTQHGFYSFKLYYMIGLPTETQEDIDELISNIGHLLKFKGVNLKLSFSHFVPKAGTEMSGSPFTSLKTVRQRTSWIRKKLKIRDIKVESNENTIVQAAFSRIPEVLIQDSIDLDQGSPGFIFPDHEKIRRYERLILNQNH